MATKMTVVYECTECGTEITINSDGKKSVDPIYCCGYPLFKKAKAPVDAATKKSTKSLSKKTSGIGKTRMTLKKAASRPAKKK